MENIQAMATIIGIVNGIQLYFDNRRGFYLFLCAVGLGIILGYFRMFGLTVESGLVSALASSGLYKVAQKVGGL